MSTKLGRILTYLDGLLAIKTNDPLIMWSCEMTWQTKAIISQNTTVYVATKLGRMMTYLKQLPPTKLL